MFALRKQTHLPDVFFFIPNVPTKLKRYRGA